MSLRPRDVGLALGLTLGVFLAFGGAGENGFVDYDDPEYVFENEQVVRGLTLENVRWAFTHFHASNWHPLTWLSHMLDVELFGLRPGGHHGTNVLLHALNAVLLFGALRALGRASWTSFFVAALFAWHPLRVESVAWVAERKDLLSASFFFLALLAYAAYSRAPSRKRMAWVVLCMALGLMAKPMLVTLPFVLLLVDLWPLRRPEPVARRLVEKLPLFFLSAASVVVTLAAQAGARSTLEALPFTLRLENALASVGVYVLQTLDPRQLAVFYPHAAATAARPQSELLVPAVFWGGVLVLGTVLAWRGRSRRPWWLAGLGWYVVMLLPVIGLVQVGVHAHADRYTYLPLVGLLLAGARELRDVVRDNRTWRIAIVGAVLAALLACLLLTRQQVSVWRSTQTLFEHALAVTEKNYVAHHSLGLALLDRDRPDEARAQFEAALAIRPDYAEALNNLGLLLFEEGRFEAARRHFELALRASPGDPKTLMNLGSVALARNELEAAADAFRRAADAGEAGADLEFNLGLLAQKQGDLGAAGARYRAALARDPDHFQAWSNLGGVLLRRDATAEAVSAFERAAQLDSADPVAHFNLGVAFEKDGNAAAAARAFRAALERDPSLTLAAERLRALEGEE